MTALPRDTARIGYGSGPGCARVVAIAGLAILGAIIGMACSGGEGGDSADAPATQPVERIRERTITPVSPSPTSSTPAPPSLTMFDRQCMQWGNISDYRVGMTEQDVRQNYETWEAETIPLCRDLANGARETCRDIRSAGYDPFNIDELELFTALAGLSESEANNIIAAILIWC